MLLDCMKHCFISDYLCISVNHTFFIISDCCLSYCYVAAKRDRGREEREKGEREKERYWVWSGILQTSRPHFLFFFQIVHQLGAKQIHEPMRDIFFKPPQFLPILFARFFPSEEATPISTFESILSFSASNN